VRASLASLGILALFVHVLDGRFVDHQVGLSIAVQLDAGFVIPLDNAVNLLAIA